MLYLCTTWRKLRSFLLFLAQKWARTTSKVGKISSDLGKITFDLVFSMSDVVTLSLYFAPKISYFERNTLFSEKNTYFLSRQKSKTFLWEYGLTFTDKLAENADRKMTFWHESLKSIEKQAWHAFCSLLVQKVVLCNLYSKYEPHNLITLFSIRVDK